MTGVVVGMGQAGRSGPAVRWASAEAAVRGLELALVHAWHEPLDLSVELCPQSLPDLLAAATSRAVHGAPAAVLLAQQPELLVLGGPVGARHLSRVTRACLRLASCPVVVVPDIERPPTGRVVVGACGTAASRVALAWAGREAWLRGAELVVVYAWQVRPTSLRQVLTPARAIPAQQDAASGRLRGWVRAVLGDTDVDVHAAHGGPLDRLLDHGAGADLMVLGRGTHTGIGGVLHGDLGHDLSALAPCPVAVIPALPSPATTLV